MATPREYDIPTVAKNAGLYNPGKELAAPATPGFVRNPAQEAAAIAAGVATKAEIEARGGVNASGYYGDSYNPATSLTDAEYAAAVAGKTGAEQGAAINAASAAKAAASLSPEEKKAAEDKAIADKAAADKAIVDANKPTLALDTFRATLGLIFGKEEVTKSYVSKLYSLTSGFYKTGSTVDEAMNLALYQAENENAIPEFTSRFAGLFALRDAKQKGAALTVPTIAEFFATEAKMGEVLNNAGLGELATESFLGGIIGKNKSVNEVATLISDVFNTIDYAPKELKQSLSTYFPGVDRTAIAKAILTGPDGAQALSQKIKGVSVMTAAQQYGMNVDLTTATDIANRGYDYNTALTGYGQVSSLGRANTVAQFGGGQFTQEQAQNAVFMKNANDLSQLSSLKNVEEARFQGSSGASKGAFSTQYLNKGSSAGQF
jgi:hypothetical protein